MLVYEQTDPGKTHSRKVATSRGDRDFSLRFLWFYRKHVLYSLFEKKRDIFTKQTSKNDPRQVQSFQVCAPRSTRDMRKP